MTLYNVMTHCTKVYMYILLHVQRGVTPERNFARWTQGRCHFGVRVLVGVLSALAGSWGRLMTRLGRSEAPN